MANGAMGIKKNALLNKVKILFMNEAEMRTFSGNSYAVSVEIFNFKY